MLIFVSGDSIVVDHRLVGSRKILLTAGRGTAFDWAYDAGWKPSALAFLSKMPVLGPGALRAINALNFAAGGISILSGSTNIRGREALCLAFGPRRARIALIGLYCRCIRSRKAGCGLNSAKILGYTTLRCGPRSCSTLRTVKSRWTGTSSCSRGTRSLAIEPGRAGLTVQEVSFYNRIVAGAI